MSVGKIFAVLIIAVLMVLAGALLLNVVFPVASSSIINGIEGQVYNATGMQLDFNGDGYAGGHASKSAGAKENYGTDGINGFKSGQKDTSN